MPNTRVVNVGKEFNRFPAGRFYTDGPFSGEKFRQEVLIPLLDAVDRIEIELDDTLGYGSSFLDEAFGGAVRQGIAAETMRRKIVLVTEDAALQAEILDYIADAEKTK